MERLREALAATGHDVGSAELLDVLWLARVMAEHATPGTEPSGGTANRAPGDPSRDGDDAADRPGAPATASGAPHSDTSGKGPDDELGRQDAAARQSLYAGHGTGSPTVGTAARALRVPGARALPRAGQLARSLRPLRTHRRHPYRTVADVEATVRASAESGLLDIVCRPERELGCDAVVLVDDAPSMQAWRSLVPEVERLLERSGVFRTVRLQGLTPQRPRARRQGAPASSTFTFLLTDGVHPAWASPAMRRAVTAWRWRGPVVVLNPLPRRLWRGTALDPLPRPLTTGRAAPALPVLPLMPAAVTSWIQALAQSGTPRLIDTALLADEGAAEWAQAPDVTEDLTADQLIARFRGAFSPNAYRLAVRLTAVGPAPPFVMQLVRLATLPDSTSAHVAELLVGGLLEPVPGGALRYDFKPGVRDLLASGLSKRQSLDVHEAVGRALEPYRGRLPDFAAVAADRDGRTGVPEGASAFASVAAPPAPVERFHRTVGGGVTLLRAPALAIADDAASGNLLSRLVERFAQTRGYHPGSSQVRAWGKAVPALASLLVTAGLGDVDMLLDYNLPLTSKRADVVLAGRHPLTGEPSYVVVEMTRWTQAEPLEDEPLLVRVEAYERPLLHPLEQVRGYVDYLVTHNQELADRPERVAGVAYLYNATEFGVGGLYEAEQDDHARLFSGERGGQFTDFLHSRLSPAPDSSAGDALLAGRVGPARPLLDRAADEFRSRQQFVLLDEQRLAYRMVYRTVRGALRDGGKEVIVVTGGPGTGKSVIALSLIGELYRQGITVLHATGSQAFTSTMRKVAGVRKREVQDLFKYFNSFTNAEPNSLDVLLCDEAHRIRETSANRYTPASERSGRAQIDELIDVARVPVFLLDEHQAVRPGELGTVARIRAAAQAKGLDCRVVALDSQFRGGGSAAYANWVVRLLELEPGGPRAWTPDDRMRLLVAQSPRELEEFLERRVKEGYSARTTAGYCWPWTQAAASSGTLPADVRIGDWHRPWNVSGDRAVAGAPPARLWATDPTGFGQIGSVYAAQGFEYDWSGVIIGPELVWRGDRWVTDRSASRDPAFRPRSVPDSDVDRLIRNAYKVLLTRGVAGTVIYSTDPETRVKLSELVPGRILAGTLSP